MIKGLPWPLRFGNVNVLETIYDEDVIKTAILSILCTFQGERVMRPTVGTDAYGLLFENADAVVMEAAVRNSVINAIRRSDARIILTAVDVTVQDETVTIFVEYEWNNKVDDVSVTYKRSIAV